MATSFAAAALVFGGRDAIGLASSQAGDIAGTVLRIGDWACLVGFPLLLGLNQLVRRPTEATAGRALAVLGFLVVGLLATLLETAWITPTIQGLREAAAVQYGGLADAPTEFRRAFGLWHGASVARAIAVAGCLAGAWVAHECRRVP